MTKYAVYWDDGIHCNQIDVFTSLKQATKFFVSEVIEAKKDLEIYFGSSPKEWDDDFYGHIELSEVDDEDECYVETLNVWTLEGFDFPVTEDK